jgi:adenylate cyclase
VLKNITHPCAPTDHRHGTLPVRPNQALPNKPSIAILPFQNMSDDPEQDISPPVSPTTITDLSKISAFRDARNSSFTYRGKVQAVDVCRDLEFTPRSSAPSGNRVRNCPNIDGKIKAICGPERFDRELTDIPWCRMRSLGTLLQLSPCACCLTKDSAWHLTERLNRGLRFLPARVHQVYLATKDSNAEARILLERAITLNPDWARPYANLSHNYLFAYVNGWDVSAEPALQRAYELALQSISLDGDDPEVHWNLGLIHLWRREHDLAIASERTVVARYPSFATGHAALGSAPNYAGRSKEGSSRY